MQGIYCLVRAPDQRSAATRVQESLRSRLVYHTLDNIARSKIVAVPYMPGKAQLGLSSETYGFLSSKITRVLHLAWSVNFNKTLESFEKDCIEGVQDLINLCLSAERSQPASFFFCSSVSATAATPGNNVEERLPKELSHAQGMGYAQSKLVAEHLCLRAAAEAGLHTQVLRVGQIIGDTVHGVWNAAEAVPMLLQSAQTIGALPKLEETPSWLPVDTVADSIVDIMFSDAESGVMNIVNHKTFHWTNDLLPLLKEAGLSFEEVSQRQWVDRLRNSNQDPEQNPPIKLVDFFANKYDTDKQRRSLMHDTARARQYSSSLRNAPVVDSVSMRKIIDRFRQTAWSSPSTATKSPLVIVVGGPCGSGKTRLATELSAALQMSYIEGDDLHSRAARQRMAAHLALTDDDRWTWLAHIRGAVLDRLSMAGTQAVVVSCSALKASYRDELRLLSDLNGARVLFVMLSTDCKAALQARLASRNDHYMDPVMVEEQVEIFEKARLDETDIVPVDAAMTFESVFEDVYTVVKATL